MKSLLCDIFMCVCMSVYVCVCVCMYIFVYMQYAHGGALWWGAESHCTSMTMVMMLFEQELRAELKPLEWFKMERHLYSYALGAD